MLLKYKWRTGWLHSSWRAIVLLRRGGDRSSAECALGCPDQELRLPFAQMTKCTRVSKDGVRVSLILSAAFSGCRSNIQPEFAAAERITDKGLHISFNNRRVRYLADPESCSFPVRQLVPSPAARRCSLRTGNTFCVISVTWRMPGNVTARTQSCG